MITNKTFELNTSITGKVTLTLTHNEHQNYMSADYGFSEVGQNSANCSHIIKVTSDGFRSRDDGFRWAMREAEEFTNIINKLRLELTQNRALDDYDVALIGFENDKFNVIFVKTSDDFAKINTMFTYALLDLTPFKKRDKTQHTNLEFDKTLNNFKRDVQIWCLGHINDIVINIPDVLKIKLDITEKLKKIHIMKHINGIAQSQGEPIVYESIREFYEDVEILVKNLINTVNLTLEKRLDLSTDHEFYICKARNNKLVVTENPKKVGGNEIGIVNYSVVYQFNLADGYYINLDYLKQTCDDTLNKLNDLFIIQK
ncbi:hypothetical protein GCM10023211_22300 [Orbus sasakiae]|uniref:Uncharacterized protein n=1 Tax=Orbus sasakiae TaxID=1078475 RepID=A0ABP9NBJ8_9GAMM